MAHKKVRNYDSLPLISREDARGNGLSQFFTGQPCKHGHIAPRYVSYGGCVICSAQAALSYQKVLYQTDPEEAQRRQRLYVARNPAKRMALAAKKRAQKKGLSFTITASDIHVPENCPCCGVKMEARVGLSQSGGQPQSPSLDRLDNTIGYEPGNVAVICWRCNELKRNATLSELEGIVRWLKSHEPKDRLLRLVG